MLITSRGNVNNDVPIQIRLCRRGCRHFPEAAQLCIKVSAIAVGRYKMRPRKSREVKSELTMERIGGKERFRMSQEL
jgi:hypothetical protein